MKKSGIDPTSRPLPGGGGGVSSIGTNFRPNLAMGGGSYKLPFDLPHGPGGATPKLELLYSTGLGAGHFGLGWSLAVPFIEWRRPSAFVPQSEDEFTLTGAEPLIRLDGGDYMPFAASEPQRFRRMADHWECTTPELMHTSFGTTAQARVQGTVDGVLRTVRWMLETVTFANGMTVHYDYDHVDNEHRLAAIRWSEYRLDLHYETRPDPNVRYNLGFAQALNSRCHQVSLSTTLGGADRVARIWDFDYEQATAVGTSLLSEITLTGFHNEAGAQVATSLAPVRFDYTRFEPKSQRIEALRSSTIPPPVLDTDTTLFDYLGSSLPGVLRLTPDGGTYWENRGDGTFGAPITLDELPAGVRLRRDEVQFADLNGTGTADLIVGGAGTGSWYEHDPEVGFKRRQTLDLAPGFNSATTRARFADLDGDGVVDLLVLQDGQPLGFFNDRGNGWSGPVVLPWGDAPTQIGRDRRLRFADMNGDGNIDLVLLRANGILYWPGLGGGRFGSSVMMTDSPAFDVANPDRDILLADVDGDGTADLIILGAGRISMHLNRAGVGFGPPIELTRTPRLGGDSTLLADMRGTGSPGLLWADERGALSNGRYHYLDLLGGTKPYLLSSINNGGGQVSTIEYATSASERSLDLADGRRWTGYLPFAVHVVKSIVARDLVTDSEAVTHYRYHDGHYDGQSRQWLGFGQVDSETSATSHEAATTQRMWFHNQTATATVPAFIAGRGQPHRTEHVDPASAEVRAVSTSTWDALPVPDGDAKAGPFITVETQRESQRLQNDIEYESERFEFSHDPNGNIIREHRHGFWSDATNNSHHDELIITTRYAIHPTSGITSFIARQLRLDGTGNLIKCFDRFYDGDAFEGLPAGEVTKGYLTRQTEVALTAAQVTAAYGANPPSLLSTLYREDNDVTLGQVFLRDMVRNRLDAHGNQLESIDSAGMQTEFRYESDAISPVAIRVAGGTERTIEFDPIAQQASNVEDRNGNRVITRFDGLGHILAIWRRSALPDQPTETYTYDRSVVPHRVTQSVRVQVDDATPGWTRHSYLDGQGRPVQTRTLSSDGRWAVAPATFYSARGKEVSRNESYFSASAAYEPSPPPGLVSRHTYYDFANRPTHQVLYDGSKTTYRYDKAATHFFDPAAALALEASPSTPPSRSSRHDAWGRIVAIVEPDVVAVEQIRTYDSDGQLIAIVDTDGHAILRCVLDGWGNRIFIESAEAGVSMFIFDAANNLVLSTDADGREVFRRYDEQNRVLELRHGGPSGTVEETYTYDTGSGTNLVGRLASVSGSFGSAEYSYNADGRATQITRRVTGNPTPFDIHFTYDAQNNPRSVRYPDGHTVDYGYSDDGLLTSISGVIDDVEYDAAGDRTRVVYANGLETRRTLTAGDQLLREILTEPTGGGHRYQHLVYGLDATGRVDQVDDLSSVPGKLRNNQSFLYDSRNRLAKANGRGVNGPISIDYRYDAAGNLIDGERYLGMSYGHEGGDPSHPNRLISHDAANAGDYTYDLSGNLTADPDVGDLVYDDRHRLIQVVRPNGDTIDYSYDHLDNRVATKVTNASGSNTRYEIEGIFLVTGSDTTKVVFDESRRLALLPSTGEGILHHFDRIGNVNVISNLATGAFVANHEYTPWGQLIATLFVQHRYTFQGALLDENIDIVLLGARWYRPALGRFLTPDRYLLVEQNKIPGIIVGANLYLYALDNPVNFVDPTGQIAFITALIIAAIVGAVLGAIGAAVNGVSTWDEFLLWVIGGAIGGMLAVVAWTGIIIGVAAIFGASVSVAAAATAGLVIYSVAGILGATLTKVLDETNSGVAWFFSFLIKYAQSPIITTVGLVAAIVVGIAGGDVDFRRGMLFIEVGPGGSALTLGAVAWTQAGLFDMMGNVPDDLARHEAVHSRTIASIGELGFYFTYLTFGVAFAAGAGAPWNDLDGNGCGNPFEKTAHTERGGPTTAVSASNMLC